MLRKVYTAQYCIEGPGVGTHEQVVEQPKSALIDNDVSFRYDSETIFTDASVW